MRAEPPKIFGKRRGDEHDVTAPASGVAHKRAMSNLKPFFSPLAWSSAGFIAGALFWHGIGFWSFVSGVVFNQDDGHANIAAWSKPQTLSEAETVAPHGANRNFELSTKLCRELVRDAQTGITAEQACTPRWRPNIIIGYRGTRDLERVALAARQTKPASSENEQISSIEIASDSNKLSTGTLTEADIDLNITSAIIPAR